MKKIGLYFPVVNITIPDNKYVATFNLTYCVTRNLYKSRRLSTSLSNNEGGALIYEDSLCETRESDSTRIKGERTLPSKP